MAENELEDNLLVIFSEKEIPVDFTGIAKFHYLRSDKKVYSIIYFKNGLRHRTNGPAVYYPLQYNKKYYWFRGKCLKEQEWFERLTHEEKVSVFMNPETFK